eukprot:SAG22_NODE_388_length_11295_cov_14.512594_16_plen_506_part_00
MIRVPAQTQLYIDISAHGRRTIDDRRELLSSNVSTMAAPAPPAAAAAISAWSPKVFAGGVIAALGFGISCSFGLFVEPITDSLGFGREKISLAVGISMMVNGVSSIFWGHLSDRFGIARTVSVGVVLLFCALWLTSFGRAPGHFFVSIPLTGFADGSISPGIILGTVGRRYTDEVQRSKAMGLSSAIQSCGAVFVPPLIGLAIAAFAKDEWYWAFRVVACVSLLAIPLVILISRGAAPPPPPPPPPPLQLEPAGSSGSAGPVAAVAAAVPRADEPSSVPGLPKPAKQKEEGKDTKARPLAVQAAVPSAAAAVSAVTIRETITVGFTSGSYVLLVAGFFACGFHVVFITTHLDAHCTDQGLGEWVGPLALGFIGVGACALCCWELAGRLTVDPAAPACLLSQSLHSTKSCEVPLTLVLSLLLLCVLLLVRGRTMPRHATSYCALAMQIGRQHLRDFPGRQGRGALPSRQGPGPRRDIRAPSGALRRHGVSSQEGNAFLLWFHGLSV